MSELTFDDSDHVLLPTKYHGEFSLSKTKWNIICTQPERVWYRFNGEKVATTLVNPDYVRHHKAIDSQFLYYKEFTHFNITENVEVPMSHRFKFFCVVIDTCTNKICTVYPVEKPKKGKEYRPK